MPGMNGARRCDLNEIGSGVPMRNAIQRPVPHRHTRTDRTRARRGSSRALSPKAERLALSPRRRSRTTMRDCRNTRSAWRDRGSTARARCGELAREQPSRTLESARARSCGSPRAAAALDLVRARRVGTEHTQANPLDDVLAAATVALASPSRVSAAAVRRALDHLEHAVTVA